MTTRTAGPFQYYDEAFAASGVTGDSIRATADQPGKDAAAITALAGDLSRDERHTATEIEGQIRTAVAHAPKLVKDKATALGANGTYAVGLVKQFATYVDTFDGTVNALNVQYHHQMDVLRRTALGQPLSGSDALDSLMLGPLYGVSSPVVTPTSDDPLGLLTSVATAPAPSFDAKAVGAQVYQSLLPQYRHAHGVLDTNAEHVATMFKQGATPANVHDLIDAGAIPLSAAVLYPGLRLTADDIRKALAADPMFADMPAITDPRFRDWFSKLSPWEQQLAMFQMASTFPPKDFNPYSTIKPGQLPPWALAMGCFTNTPDGGAPFLTTGPGTYGYFGGGTILGPGGVQWPIAMPYFQEGNHIYMADDGEWRADGGINQLDGHDPGWMTVATYSGLNQYGSISTGTKVATAFLIGTGQDLETTQTDPGAVVIGPDGTPYAGHDVTEVPEGPPDKAYWDVTSKEMFPGEADRVVGPTALAVQGMQAAQAVHNEDSHASRQWYVSYQVNDDGRTRAIVHTYSATPSEDDKTYVGSFANAFPDGNGETTEIPYNTRFNPYHQTVMTAAPDPDVEYSGHGEPLDNSEPIHEKMNK